MASLQHLPPEIVHHIVAFLESPPPSEHSLFSEPSVNTLRHPLQPLKALSRTNRKTRLPCMRLLLQHLKVDCHSPLDDLLVLLAKYQVHRVCIKSAVISEETTQNDNYDVSRVWETTVDVLTRIDPAIITFALPPIALTSIVTLPEQLPDAWAFRIPLQILRLERDTSDEACSGDDANLPLSHDERHIFGFRPWTKLLFNEGPSVAAYSTYEYFHLNKPSWIIQSDLITQVMWSSRNYLSRLNCFDYVAVFPYHDMSVLCNFCDQLRSLRVIRIQLTPRTERSAAGVNRSCDIDSGRADPKDLWMEFEKALNSFAKWVTEDCSLPHLKRVELLDYANEALRDTIDKCLQQHAYSWARYGGYTWSRINPGPLDH